MKRSNLIGWALALTACLCMMFTACKKDKDNGGSGGGIATTINATDIIIVGSDEYLETVKGGARDEWDEDDMLVLASCKYADNSFKLNLPGTVNSEYKYLFNIGDGLEGLDIVVSAPDAKMTIAWMEGFDDDDDWAGTFWYGNDKYSPGSEEFENDCAMYLYVDRDVTIMGTDTYYDEEWDETWIEIYDCTLKKGWNVVYNSYSYNYDDDISTDAYTTQKPAGATYQWAFFDYNNWKKSPAKNVGKNSHNPFAKHKTK
jgi:hypothetical protein